MAFDRTPLRRMVAVANGKGGVGKTSTSSHVGGLLAEAGHRVLLVDLDPQGNLGEDFGYTGADLSDDGQGLLQAVLTGQPPMILREVRPGLDVIPGGMYLHDLAAALESRQRRSTEDAALALAMVLAQVAGEYDMALIDCPPGQEVLVRAALAASEYLLVPTKTDQSSRKGLREMARRFVQAKAVNPELQLLGVLLFGVTRAATKVIASARAMIEEELGGVAPVFTSTIRHVEAAAVDIRDRGQLAYELERIVATTKPATGERRLAASSGSLAGDYQQVTEEFVAQLLRLEAARAEAIA